MNKDIVNLQNLIVEIGSLHQAFYDLIVPITDQVKGGVYAVKELADLGFLFREGETILDDWRKDSKSRKELIGRMLALLIVEQNTTDLVHGELCRAQIDLKMRPEMPKVGTKEYYDLCHHYGIDDPDNTPIRISWKGIEEECSKLTEQGKPLPPGMKKPKAQFSCKFTKKAKTNGKN